MISKSAVSIILTILGLFVSIPILRVIFSSDFSSNTKYCEYEVLEIISVARY